MGFPNPSITGAAIGEALGANGPTPSGQVAGREAQAALDAAELRELERAESQGKPWSEEPESIQPAVAPHRSLLDRLFRR
jgi:hypothetical protein